MNKYISSAYCYTTNIKSHDKQHLPDIAQLRDKRVKHIDIIPTNDNYPIFITIREKNTQEEMIEALPTSLLNGKNERLFINKIIDMPKCYITTGEVGSIEGQELKIIFYYDDYLFASKITPQKNKTQVIPLELKLTGKKTYFAENNLLKNKKYQNIILTYPYTTPKGNTGIAYELEPSASLTLSHRNNEFFKNIPLSVFYQSQTPYPLRLQNIEFDLTKSYIQTTDPQHIGKSVYFNCIIDDNQ